MGTDRELNPYAPPAAVEDAPFVIEAKEGVSYESARQSVVVTIILSIITLGIYTAVWVILRRPFLESLRTRQRLGIELPVISLAATGLQWIMLVVAPRSQLETVLSLASSIPMIMACFRAKRMIEEELVAMGRPNRLSGVATFFLSIYYLQWRINQLADVARDAPEPAAPRRKKKKARRKRRDKTAEPAVAPPTESP